TFGSSHLIWGPSSVCSIRASEASCMMQILGRGFRGGGHGARTTLIGRGGRRP
ncbi:unnamed protein product, partial [Rotaria magnacalcarata]